MNLRMSKASFISALHNQLPAMSNEFPKLIAGAPYNFDHWKDDGLGSEWLYYWFCSHDGSKRYKKRVAVSETYIALQYLLSVGTFNRKAYRLHCPMSERSGPCGFA